MRELRTTARVVATGNSRHTIAWAKQAGRWTAIIRGVVGRGPEPPSKLDIARATALATNGVAVGLAAGEILGFDGVKCDGPEVVVARGSAKRTGVRRISELPRYRVVEGVRCLPPAETLFVLAARLDDVLFEQAVEFCLRNRHVTPDELLEWAQGNSVGARRVSRVLKLRGGVLVPATGSLLETLAVQLMRKDPSIPTPTRQLTIYDEHGNFVGQPDLCWPELGLFLELDGQDHKDQPVYDARRQTRITIATGWRCGRMTWDEVHNNPVATLRQLAELVRAPAKVSSPPFGGGEIGITTGSGPVIGGSSPPPRAQFSYTNRITGSRRLGA